MLYAFSFGIDELRRFCCVFNRFHFTFVATNRTCYLISANLARCHGSLLSNRLSKEQSCIHSSYGPEYSIIVTKSFFVF